MTRLIVALDTPSLDHARRLADTLAPVAHMLKLGLEFFAAHGVPGVRVIAEAGLPIFLDLKLHDIPTTVGAAVTALAPARACLLTIHAAGGPAMITAARDSAARDSAALMADQRPRILAVTVLTSLDAATLHATGVAGGTMQQVLRLARLATEAGADGLVCGPREVAAIRAALGPSPILVVPGIRPAGHDPDDQARSATPAEAARDGADWIVVGRPITRAADPAEAARAIAGDLA